MFIFYLYGSSIHACNTLPSLSFLHLVSHPSPPSLLRLHPYLWVYSYSRCWNDDWWVLEPRWRARVKIQLNPVHYVQIHLSICLSHTALSTNLIVFLPIFWSIYLSRTPLSTNLLVYTYIILRYIPIYWYIYLSLTPLSTNLLVYIQIY